jgi:ribonuclease HI
VLMTNTKEELAHQWRKIKNFMTWSGMSMNATKCAMSCILHKSQPHQQVPQIPDHVRKFICRYMRVGNKHLPILLPTDAYKYLGVWVTLTLNWGRQVVEAIEAAKTRGEAVSTSLASPKQRLQVIKSCIRSALAYPLPVALYTTEDIKRLDSCICGIVKKCLHLPRGLSNVAIHRDTAAGGLGVTSLQVDYCQLAGAALVRCMNDKGRLGRIGRALLDLQGKRMGNIPVNELLHEAKYYTVLRQLTLINEQGLDVITRGSPYLRPDHPLWSFLKANNVEQQAPGGPIPTLATDALPQIPATILASLENVGVHCVQDLLTNDGESFMMAQDMKSRYPKATDKHRVALNQITLLVTRKQPPEAALAHNSPSTLTPAQRLLPPLPAACNAYLTRQGVRSGKYLEQLTLPKVLLKRTRNAQPHGLPPTPPHPQQQAATHASPAKPKDKHRTGKTETGKRKRQPTNKQKAANNSREHAEQNARITTNVSPHPTIITLPGCIEELARRPELCTSNITMEDLHKLYDEMERVQVITHHKQIRVPTDLLKQSNGSDISDMENEGDTDFEIQCLYLTKWAETVIHVEHLGPYAELKYNPAPGTTPIPYPTPGHPSHVKMVRVQWEPTWEPWEPETNSEDLRAALAAYHARQAEHEAGRSTRDTSVIPRNKDQTNLRQQGNFGEENCSWDGYATASRQAVASHVLLDPRPQNPDLDIQAAAVGQGGRFRIQIGRHTNPSGADEMNLTDGDTAFVYDPLGHCLGATTPDRIARVLEARRLALARQTEGRRGVFEDIARLFIRHKTSRKGPKHRTYALPKHYIATLKQIGGVTVERFANPLTAEMGTYYSTHLDDVALGSMGDPYSTPWVGCSVAIPPFETHAVGKAVRWAVASAAGTDAPCATYLVAPAWMGSMHTQFINHPYVLEFDRFKKGTFPLLEYTAFSPQPEEIHKYTVVVYLIANAAGVEQYLGGTADTTVTALCRAYRIRMRDWADEKDAHEASHTRSPVPGTSPYPGWDKMRTRTWHQRHSLPKTPAPRKLAAMLKALERTPANLPTGPPPEQHVAPRYNEENVRRNMPAHKPLACDPRNAVYTDGSCTTPETGGPNVCAAAVHLPDPHAPLGEQDQGTVIRVQPNGYGPTNTITRAELSGIAAALDHCINDNVLTIFTDSQCSIHLIRKMLYEPHLLQEGKHRHLLRRIKETLIARSLANRRTSILKVPAHAGVQGNEAADAAATAMTAGRPKSADVIDEVCEPSTSDAYGDLTWVGRVVKKNEQEEIFYVNDLTTTLKKWVHKACVDGHANTEGFYAQKNSEVALIADLAHSDHAWRSNTPFRSCLTAFKARWGQLYNQRLAFRYRFANNIACPLCGLDDGAGHILSGCSNKDMKAMYISRHNKAVQMIRKAIMKHSDMGGYYTVMDACPAAELARYGATTNRIPQWLLPNTVKAERILFRPDLLTVEGYQADGDVAYYDQGSKRVYLLEVGYCSDISMPERLPEKSKQHLELITRLEDEGHNVLLHTLMLGTSGTILTSLKDHLKEGYKMPTHSVTKLLNKLNDHAVNTAQAITCKRREMEKAVGRNYRSGPGHG